MRRVVAVVGLAWAFACGGGVGTPLPEPGEPGLGDPAVDPEPAVAREATKPERPSFPLRAGESWTWQVTRHTGAGLRVLFMATEPARNDVVATWKLTIDEARPDGHVAATWTQEAPDTLPSSTKLELWHQGDALWMQGPSGPTLALEIEVPPDAVAPERVPCVAHFLGNKQGTCSPAPGGPLDVPPGPVSVVVSADRDNGRTLAQVLVGIGTAGLLIPGNRAATEVAELVAHTSPEPPPASPLVEAFRKKPVPATVTRAAELDREEVAACVALAAAADRVAVARAGLGRLSPGDRAPVVRVVLGTLDPTERLPALGALAPDLQGVPLETVVAQLPDDDREAGARVVSGEWPVLAATLKDPRDTARIRAAAAALPPSRGEAERVLARASEPEALLAPLLAGTPSDQRPDLVASACATRSFDSDRMELLTPSLASLPATPEAASRVLDTFTFDSGRKDATAAWLRAAPEDRRPPILAVGAIGMNFDDERLALLRDFPAERARLKPTDRDRVLASFGSHRAEAEALLRP